MRGIRLSLGRPEILRAQARALMAAAPSGQLRVLLPMISGIEELRRARLLFDEAAADMRGRAGTPRVALGVMIEVPSAVTMSDVLAREADFFSIGSNDLTQYLLAVDRGNEEIAELYDPLDPAVLRALQLCVTHGHAGRLTVGCCGEMAGDMLGALLLIGLGVDSLSVAPPRVAWLKAMISHVRSAELERLARRCVDADCATDVRRLAREALASQAQFRFEEQGRRLVGHWEPEV
jgi:phosphoenolpyruvate-protein kinase (PTS system EI component)